MRQKYGLTPHAWQVIKGKLGLYKDSHVFSPEGDDSDERIVEVIDKHFNDKVVGKMVVTHEKKFKKEADRALKFLYNQEYYLGELQKFIENWQPREPESELPPQVNEDWKHYFISDIHIGKIGTDDVMKRLDAVKNEIISSPE